MSQAVFDCSELSDYTKKLIDDLEKNFPKEYDNFLKQEARRIRTGIKKEASKRFQKITGNFLKGTKIGRPYDYGDMRSIRTYGGSPAYHAHLLEYGHVIKKRGKDKGKRQKTSPFAAERKAAKLTYGTPGLGGRTRAFGSYIAERQNEAEMFSKNFETFYNKLLRKAGHS